ncbi:hypothetical protein QBC43DRAFT_240805, partial [Cladorrhinum sp. PSN259]
MSNDTKDPKAKSEGTRRPQRKDSFTSVLQWAGLQGKHPISKSGASSGPSSPTTSTAPSTPSQALPSLASSKPRRHSHSFDNKKKARPESISRKFSFSNLLGVPEGTGAKTKNVKPTVFTPDSKASDATSKSGKNGSAEKASKPASTDSGPGKNVSPILIAFLYSNSDRDNFCRSPPPPPPTPAVRPKSILRVSSSPEGCARPKSVDMDGKEPISPELISSSAESPPGSPLIPTINFNRPATPGVRFAKATIHRVEVGPGRRFLPVKRRSKSTMTYVSPLDPGIQKSVPKTILQSPTKYKRHKENQAAMGRYWLRTEEEEAEEREEAARKAQEEAERYRNEPSSPPPLSEEEALVKSELAGKLAVIDKLPLLDSLPGLEKVEEEDEEDDSSDTDSDSDSDSDS